MVGRIEVGLFNNLEKNNCGKFFHFWVEDNEKDPVVEPNLIHVEE